jgi:sugar/nucleoside kinase (ribokinase family)
MKALVIGVSSYDTIIQVDNLPKNILSDMSVWAKNVHHTLGGTGAGKALTLDCLGLKTKLVTDLGPDEYKDKVLDFYKQTNIDVSVLKSDQTTTHTNIMHDEDKRLSIFTNTPKSIDTSLDIDHEIRDADLVFLNINDYAKSYIPSTKKYKKKIVVDIHDYDIGNPYHQPFIDVSDILFVSDIHIKDDLTFLNKMIVGKELVVITKGKKGCIAIDSHHNIYRQDAIFAFDFVDSNGAGDAFSAGFMVAYYQKISVKDALKYASICGALSCSSHDLFPLDFDIDSISKYMK